MGVVGAAGRRGGKYSVSSRRKSQRITGYHIIETSITTTTARGHGNTDGIGREGLAIEIEAGGWWSRSACGCRRGYIETEFLSHCCRHQ